MEWVITFDQISVKWSIYLPHAPLTIKKIVESMNPNDGKCVSKLIHH